MGGPLKHNLVGERFGRLLVISRAPNSPTGKPMWNCVCDCGTECVKQSSALVNGCTRSCGCYNIERLKELKTKHGDAHSRLYGVWCGMRQRCLDENHHAYKDYGARGITVCDEWANDYKVFMDWAFANGYDKDAKPHECTLDRIDNNKGYSPDNCRFVDPIVQANNTRNNRWITYNGETKTLAQWSKKVGINAFTISDRIERGWTLEEAFTVKPEKGRNQTWRKHQ